MRPKHNRLITDALREIRKTKSRFLSLLLLSALAVAFLSGLRTTAPVMEHTADGYYDSHNLMDIHVLSTLGLTDDDINYLSSLEDISAAEGAYTADGILHLESNDLVVKLVSLSEQGINSPELVEGRLPEADDECLVEPKLLEEAEKVLLTQLDQVGRQRVRAVPMALDELVPPVRQVKAIRDTVATLRLDAVASSGFSLARSKMADAISSGKVALNGRECVKPDRTVAEGDVITCRGLGKCVLKEVSGPSKKGRTMIVIERYV